MVKLVPASKEELARRVSAPAEKPAKPEKPVKKAAKSKD
jgi:hypothetical protein